MCVSFIILIVCRSSRKFKLQSKKEGGKITKDTEKNNYKEANKLTGNLPLFVHLDQYFLFFSIAEKPSPVAAH